MQYMEDDCDQLRAEVSRLRLGVDAVSQRLTNIDQEVATLMHLMHEVAQHLPPDDESIVEVESRHDREEVTTVEKPAKDELQQERPAQKEKAEADDKLGTKKPRKSQKKPSLHKQSFHQNSLSF